MQQQMKKSTMENEKQKKGGGVVGKLLQIVTRLFGKLFSPRHVLGDGCGR